MELNVTSPAVISAAVMAAFMGVPACRELTVVNVSSVSWGTPYEVRRLYVCMCACVRVRVRVRVCVWEGGQGLGRVRLQGAAGSDAW